MDQSSLRSPAATEEEHRRYGATETTVRRMEASGAGSREMNCMSERRNRRPRAPYPEAGTIDGHHAPGISSRRPWMILLVAVIMQVSIAANPNDLAPQVAPEAEAAAAAAVERERSVTPAGFQHVLRNDITLRERFVNVGIVYAFQWVYYFAFQWETIRKHGSFRNWYTNIYQPHFDKDSFDYNLIGHTLSGTCYYLFFRSRGYSKSGSLLWGFAAHLLFEFTIEVVTEQPSIQDMFQTPVLGALVGMTLEYLSCRLLSMPYTIAHIAGYILNPFALLPGSNYRFSPSFDPSGKTMVISLSFRF
ncbi:MAG: DUF3943 domain-containing protein [Spirochaetes bacterium]|nr:DUF3943 domain-containing protein [Spirochaetota bacterium]